MRWHPRRLLLFFLLFIICILLVLYRKSGGETLKKQNKSYRRRGKITHHEKSADYIFWSQSSGVEKFHRKKQLKKKDEIDDQVIDGFNKVLESNDADDISESKQVHFNMNIDASDALPLNREIPDSRPKGCEKLRYPSSLPTTSVVIPFHNEWPSVLMRTVHSLVGGTPTNILKQIILVDDASDLNALKTRLDNYVNWTFPAGLVKIVRLTERQGLIRARLEGFKHVTTEVVSFFDSHMEVNKDWIQPLLNEIVKDPKTVAMAQLDYINNENFEYKFYEDYRTRYGFKWDMEFFETYFRPDQLEGKTETDPMPGVLMVGPGFVVRSQYFRDLGTYDSGMKIWGGENIEFAWRTWMCGGRLLHVPCSRIGHIERSQPYTFPHGRRQTELHNYKRAAEVWMGPYRKYVYDALPGIQTLDAGDLEERMKVKSKLKCKDFSWFLKNIWPELLPYQDVGSHWGQVKSVHGDGCLDNKNYLFKDPDPLELNTCTHKMIQQGFALTSDGFLRTTLHCVVVYQEGVDMIPFIQNCMLNVSHRWKYDKQRLVHIQSETCLQVMSGGKLVLQPCKENLDSQQWLFVINKTENFKTSRSILFE